LNKAVFTEGNLFRWIFFGSIIAEFEGLPSSAKVVFVIRPDPEEWCSIKNWQYFG